MDPKNVMDAAWLGSCLLEAGRERDALLVLEAAEESANEVSKSRALLWNQLGICYKRLGSFVKAGAYFLKASDVDANKNSLTLLAACQLHFFPQGALLHADKALAIDPNWDEARDVRKQALEILGRTEPDEPPSD